MTELVLTVADLARRYGGLQAVQGVSFGVRAGTITALIGPNGAGKTTILNMISGYTPPSAGEVHLAGRNVTGLRADQICRLGLARTFQTPQVFRSLTVLENVLVGASARGRTGFIETAFRLAGVAADEAELRREAAELTRLVGLEDVAEDSMGRLPFGKLRLAEIARALASHPRILVMDEPASGLSRGETGELRALLQRTRDRGVTVLIVEHNMPFIMSTADDVLVLDKGKLLASGTPADVQNNQLVQQAYLGAG